MTQHFKSLYIFHNYENLPQFFIPKCLHNFDLTYKVTDWTIGLVWFLSFQRCMEKAENDLFSLMPISSKIFWVFQTFQSLQTSPKIS